MRAGSRRTTQGPALKITGIEVIPFETFVDRFSNGEPSPMQKVLQTLTKITTDEGVEGYYFGGHFHGDQDGLLATEQALITQLVGPLLADQDPMEREKVWQQLLAGKIPENVMSVIDLALWDLAGRVAGLPVHHLLGGARDKIKTYASTYNNLGSPEEYGAHAVECKNLGYTAYKIHSHYYWDPATRQAALPRPSHVEWDIKTCHAVREAVGDEMVLMYDPWGTYNTYADAIRVGRALEDLNFYWYEHPMPEYKVASYIKLAEELTIPICSPEIADGGLFTRADWIARRASDISRIDVLRTAHEWLRQPPGPWCHQRGRLRVLRTRPPRSGCRLRRHAWIPQGGQRPHRLGRFRHGTNRAGPGLRHRVGLHRRAPHS
jgi:L-alanine-DL-glutamate epimerase-like enolase superfamily enzyme